MTKNSTEISQLEHELVVEVREETRAKVYLFINGKSLFVSAFSSETVYDLTNVQKLKECWKIIDSVKTAIRGIKITDNSQAAIKKVDRLFFDSQKNAGNIDLKSI